MECINGSCGMTGALDVQCNSGIVNVGEPGKKVQVQINNTGGSTLPAYGYRIHIELWESDTMITKGIVTPSSDLIPGQVINIELELGTIPSEWGGRIFDAKVDVDTGFGTPSIGSDVCLGLLNIGVVVPSVGVISMSVI